MTLGLWFDSVPLYAILATTLSRKNLLVRTSSTNWATPHLQRLSIPQLPICTQKLSVSQQNINSPQPCHVLTITSSPAIRPSEAAYFTNRAASYLRLKNFRAALADYQRASNLATFEPSAKTFIRVAQCQLTLGHTTRCMASLKDALALEPSHSAALEFKARVVALEKCVAEFCDFKSRGHWRLARIAYEQGREIMVDQCDVIPTDWLVWKVEVEIALGNWEDAQRAIESVHPFFFRVDIK